MFNKFRHVTSVYVFKIYPSAISHSLKYLQFTDSGQICTYFKQCRTARILELCNESVD